jgi:hypothetical protein
VTAPPPPAGPHDAVHVLVIADSLAFHGPRQPELLTNPRLYPNVLGCRLEHHLGVPVEVDVITRFGMTAREAWWAMTKDPLVYSRLLPRASAVVLGVGNMDQLPAGVPTYLRQGIDYVKTDRIRHAVAAAYHRSHPWLVRLGGARLRVLPQAATDRYLTRCVEGVRHYRPGVPVVSNVPPRHAAAYYAHRSEGHPAAAAAARVWAAHLQVPMIELEPIVAPHREAGRNNSDGMHWGWETHAEVGEAYAELLAPLVRDPIRPTP